MLGKSTTHRPVRPDMNISHWVEAKSERDRGTPPKEDSAVYGHIIRSHGMGTMRHRLTPPRQNVLQPTWAAVQHDTFVLTCLTLEHGSVPRSVALLCFVQITEQLTHGIYMWSLSWMVPRVWDMRRYINPATSPLFLTEGTWAQQ